MSLNDGQVHLDFFDKKEEYEKMAEDFSEGDPVLKETLLMLWEKGIKTIACCKGHDNGHPPYLSFIMDNYSMGVIESTCDYLYMQDGNINLNFLNNSLNNTEDHNIFSIHMNTEEDKNKYLKFLQSLLNNNYDNNKLPEGIPFYARLLLAFARNQDMHCRYIITKEEMMFGYFKKGENLLFSGEKQQLNESLNSILETKKMPLVAFTCDEKSLKQFLNVLYPRTFGNNQKNTI